MCRIIRRCTVLLFAMTATGLTLGSSRAQELTVLSNWFEFASAEERFHQHLNDLTYAILSRHDARLRDLQSAAEWETYRADVRATLEKLVSFPARAPLRSRRMGVLRREGYTVEKLVFESMPDFFVPGCLFLPDHRTDPTPAILYLSGHSKNAYKALHYQHVILNLVRKGFIVLAIDPPGQGEFHQYLDPATGAVPDTVRGGEHTYLTNPCVISGSSSYRYFIWNGVRAIDYLQSRPEVDAARIGVHGHSGGGYQTTQLAAIDPRVTASAASCYVTSWAQWMSKRGPADGEQNLNQGILHGITYPALLVARAPKPTLIMSTSRDNVPIQGARDTYAAARRGFAALGGANNLRMVEDDWVHGYTRKTMETLYAFFQQTLDLPGDPTDEDVAVLSDDELTVTPTGQVLTSLPSETIFSLNRREAERLMDRLNRSRADLPRHLARLRQDVRRVSGYEDPVPGSDPIFRGRHVQPDYTIEKWVLPGAGKTVIPLLLFRPDCQDPVPVVMYFHPAGKPTDLLLERRAGSTPDHSAGEEISSLVRRGYAVAAADIQGVGETGSVNHSMTYIGVHIGRSIVSFQAADMVRLRRYLASREDLRTDTLSAVAHGALAPALLHAAYFDPEIRRVALVDPLLSYRTVVMNQYYSVNFAQCVPNAMTAYDLPDLAGGLAPRPLVLLNLRDQLGRLASEDDLARDLAVVRAAYAHAGAAEQLREIRSTEETSAAEQYEASFR